MLGPLLQELPIYIKNDTRCSKILPGSFDPMTRLCFENMDSGTCSVSTHTLKHNNHMTDLTLFRRFRNHSSTVNPEIFASI